MFSLIILGITKQSGLGLRFSFDAQQITHFIDHAAVRRRINDSDGLVRFFQAQATNASLVCRQTANDAFDQSDGDGFLGSHDVVFNLRLTENFFDGLATLGSDFRRTAYL